MGLFESTVKTIYKADTKQMKSELRKLSKEQRAQAKIAIDSADKQNDAIDKQIAMLGKAVIAIGAVTAAYKVAQVGIEAYAERSRLNAATVGVDLDGLKKATQGLVSETRLLEFASKSMNGTFKLSQSEMETALKGVIGLRNEGNELSKTLDNVGKALQEGTSEPLKELGHNFKTVNDTATGVRDVLADLAKTAREKGGDLGIPGDAMAESQVKMKDAVDDLKISLGKLAQSLAPVIAALAKVVGYIAYLADKAEQVNEFGSFLPGQGGVQQAALNAALKKKQAELRAAVANTPTSTGYESQYENGPMFGPTFDGKVPGTKKAGRKGGRKSTGPAGGFDVFGAGTSAVTGLGSGIGGYFDGVKARTAADQDNARGIAAEDLDKYIETIEKASALKALTNDMNDSVMSSIFGTPAEMDQRTTSIIMLSDAFGGLTNAFGAGVDALITGSDSFANAFKTAIGESLRSMAVEMSISALKHTAYGLASVAFLDGRGAAAHFAAAGQFGAGAIAAGAGARLLGAGAPASTGGGAGAGAGSAGVGTASPPPGKDKGNTQVFILGDDFGSLSSRERESRFRDISRSAGFTIEGDVVQNG